LLHDAENLFSKNADLIYENLCKIKSLGLIKHIGISVYSPNQLLKIIENYDFDVAQTPINVIDRRLLKSETIKKIKKNSIKIHARSIFLQGLLLMSHEELPQNFNKWKEIFFQFDGWCKDNSFSKLEACIQFVKKYDFISKIVVGVDSYENLVDIDRAYNLESFNAISIPSSISSNDENLVNPTLWSRQ
jgi:aryl-alcohol dehydrogenase-like predicted oxidoreductase